MVQLQQQKDIFLSSAQQQRFAELCNALYERELQQLAKSATNLNALQRRIGSLSYHIRGAAEKLLACPSPLELDSHNASWQGKQAAKCPAQQLDIAGNLQWFTRHSSLGMAVCVYQNELSVHHLELDSIDRIDMPGLRVHCNKFGWFNMDGKHQEHHHEQSPHHYYQLSRPMKKHLNAACCGHRWNHKGRTQPRALTLRELLLSTTLNWR